MSVRVLVGDVRERLADLPDASVQCCVTSPPYFGLRDYGTAAWSGGDSECDHKPTFTPRSERPNTNGSKVGAGGTYNDAQDEAARAYRDVCGKCGAVRMDRQIGLEATLSEYVESLVAVFRDVRRVLRDDGVLWLNLGDSYCSQGGEDRKGSSDNGVGRGERPQSRIRQGAKPKDLLMVPARVALALQDDGWYLRSDTIWHKPNPMPESVTDRPTSAHEHIFLLTKQPRYYYDADAIREANAREWDPTNNGAFTHQSGEYDGKILGRATMPHSGLGNAHPNPAGRNCRNVWSIATMPYKEAHFATFPPEIPRRCIKAGSKPGDTILDPFAGAGTTLLVADQLGRDAVGVELNPVYAALIERRVMENAPMFATVEMVAASEQTELPF